MAGIAPQQRRRLLADSPVARLATVTDQGRPHIVPCCFVLVDQSIFSVVDGKPKTTTALKRLDNIRATEWASLVVDHYEDDWSQLWWVRVDGPATVLTSGERSEAAVDALAGKYRQYRETRPTGPVLELAIQRWSGWAAAEDRQTGNAEAEPPT